MSYRDTTSSSILVMAIAFTIITAASFNHNSAFAVSKTKTGSSSTVNLGSSGIGGSSGSSTTAKSASSVTNPNVLTKKELSSFRSCITTANKSQGLTHKVVSDCLDTAKGISPLTTSKATSSGASAADSTTAGAKTGRSSSGSSLGTG